jgi:hypothetical protein
LFIVRQVPSDPPFFYTQVVLTFAEVDNFFSHRWITVKTCGLLFEAVLAVDKDLQTGGGSQERDG